MSGAKIIEGLKAAIEGDLSRVTIAGQTWSRSEWKPIETAPKYKWILLYSPPEENERRTGQLYVATWESLSYNWKPQWVYGANGQEHSFRNGVYGATHWMPLPEPPK